MDDSVVRNVLSRIREQAVEAEVSKALDPAQQVVNVEPVDLLAGNALKIIWASRPVEFTAKSWL